MKHFDEYMKHFSEVEGWFQTPAIAIWDSLLSYQEEQRISGNMIEIGVWKGKSAALAALHCQTGEECVFVDAMPLDAAKATISQTLPQATCHYLQEQSQFLARHPFIAQGTRSFRWIHVDGEHTGQSVINDLEIAGCPTHRALCDVWVLTVCVMNRDQNKCPVNIWSAYVSVDIRF